ncbi:hypothetical protein BS78_K118800 [Paspalum vaginatum]|uniref:Uncharacterized protein n=1 Tax=Paspalum vaginatum TaxID=158149 RepID=A0A9W7XEP9_9POAL|nr:hypothetical protein BS78_K118800 [Paspalum vaginatum]
MSKAIEGLPSTWRGQGLPPLPLALLSLIFTVESSRPSTNSEGLGWPGRPKLLALPKAKLSSFATSKRRAKTFSFEARDEHESRCASPFSCWGGHGFFSKGEDSEVGEHSAR